MGSGTAIRMMRPGALALWEEAVEPGLVQLEERMALGVLNSIASTTRRGRRDAVRLFTVVRGRTLKGSETSFNMRGSG